MRRPHFLPASLILACGWLVAAMGSASAAPVSLESLLKEMTDRAAIARFPDPAYTVRQASSYDRATKTPEDAKGWFANADASQFIRVEEKEGGRREFVMMDAAGPGAVVRFWSTSGSFGGTVRFYLDGADKPAIEAPIYDLLTGKVPWAPRPLAIENAGDRNHPGGINLYVPIPYAKHCKVTFEEANPKNPKGPPPSPRYYNIEYRTYAAGTPVTTVTPEALAAARPLIARVAEQLQEGPDPAERHAGSASYSGTIKGGEELWVPAKVDLGGSAAVRRLTLAVEVDDPAKLASALRGLVLRCEFDGVETVWCPVGDFFGSGVGLNAKRSWYTTVTTRGTMVSQWVMPYQRSMRIGFSNLGTTPVKVTVGYGVDRWTWDDRSMHFHARWRSQRAIPTRPMIDWNYVTVTGKGVYLGDALAVFNPVTAWWGEGDEKIYVDGGAFPTHIGTGTEDYYGYAWCDPKLFQGPLCGQVRMDGPGNRGHTSIGRTRILDAIPFEKSFRFDMEVWHWADCKVDYAATTYFYALPGARHDRPPQPEEAAAPISEIKVFKVAGAIEAESLPIVRKSPGLPTGTQSGMSLAQGQWSGDAQLWVRGRRPGDFVELKVPAPAGDKPVKLAVHLTKSWDYGILRFTVNGEPAHGGKDLDTFDPQVKAAGPIELGTFAPKDGALILRVEVVGGNERSKDSRSYFGLDAVTVTPAP